MTRPYLHFRPSQELLDVITSISEKENLTNADVTRQLCLYGLDQYQKGSFAFRRPPAAKNNKGGPDQRNLRKTGLLISKIKSGKPLKLETNNDKTRSDNSPRRESDSK